LLALKTKIMHKNISGLIKEISDEAIERGNKFPGYLGKAVYGMSREDVENLLNIIWDELQSTKGTLNEYAKRLIV
jgi:hypothetical protein